MKHSGQIQPQQSRRTTRPSRIVVATAAAILGSVTAGVGSVAHAQSRTLCVGNGAGCLATLQAALDASHDGDVIRLGRGTFAGGVRITTSITVRGAGAAWTKISGGGPVVEIGTFDAATEPTVSIDGVTISDGLATATDNPQLPAIALGGGDLIPSGHDGTPGATVTITNSVIANNVVDPATSFPADPPLQHHASGDGAGILSFGDLTLVNDRVSGNSVNAADSVNADEAQGGGIFQASGSLTLTNTQVTANRVVGTPVGTFSDGGGILVWFSASLTMNGGRISDNIVSINSDYPPEVGTVALGGGLSVAENGSVTLDHVIVSHNSVSAATRSGTTLGYGGGIAADFHTNLTLTNSVVDGDRVDATADQPPAGLDGAIAESGGLDLFGTATITRTVVTNNTATATSQSGTMLGIGGGINPSGPAADGSGSDEPVTISDSTFHANTVTATTADGSAIAAGGAIHNMGTLALHRTIITGNTATANSPTAIAHGGGISNATFPGDPNATLSLTVTDSLIVANRADAGSDGTADGGGLYTETPVHLSRTRIFANTPVQCTGCPEV